MENFDLDLRSVQEARNLARQGAEAAKKMACMTAEQIDKILRSMLRQQRSTLPVWLRWQWKRLDLERFSIRLTRTMQHPPCFTRISEI